MKNVYNYMKLNLIYLKILSETLSKEIKKYWVIARYYIKIEIK